jgi:hypothetical protein
LDGHHDELGWVSAGRLQRSRRLNVNTSRRRVQNRSGRSMSTVYIALLDTLLVS